MSLHRGPLDQEDQEAIIVDARAGDLESLKDIFTTLIDPCALIECTDELSKSSALHMAAANGHFEVVKYLLSISPKDKVKEWVNKQNETGNTALHWASLNGKLDIVQLLCEEYEADPFIRNNFDHDAIYEAENSGQEEIETYYLKKYDVEPESTENEEETSSEKEGKQDSQPASIDNVQVREGTEIEQVTKEATEALREQTEKLQLE
ncbi:Yar1 [Kluyveromyces lactis]|nr:Yar1 [Kluyveromyces lactis]